MFMQKDQVLMVFQLLFYILDIKGFVVSSHWINLVKLHKASESKAKLGLNNRNERKNTCRNPGFVMCVCVYVRLCVGVLKTVLLN